MADHAREAAAEFARLSGVSSHDIAVVFGSGWGPAADELGDLVFSCPTTNLPYFTKTSVDGHPGIVRSVQCGAHRVLVFLGRTHLYEDHGPDATTMAVRTAAASGCRIVILTNAAGSLVESWQPGTVVLISDHLNLTGTSALHGPNFVDMTKVYDEDLRAASRAIDPNLPEGVYAQVRGPQYETPAEIRMIRTIGGDLVGMSTALEATAARAAGMRVLGLSLVSNLAAGMTDEALDHEDVLRTAATSAASMGKLLAKLISTLHIPA